MSNDKTEKGMPEINPDIIITSTPPGKPIKYSEEPSVPQEDEAPERNEAPESPEEELKKEDPKEIQDVYKDLDFIDHNIKTVAAAIQSSRDSGFTNQEFTYEQLLVLSSMLSLLQDRTSKLNYIHKAMLLRDQHLQHSIKVAYDLMTASAEKALKSREALKLTNELACKFLNAEQKAQGEE